MHFVAAALTTKKPPIPDTGMEVVEEPLKAIFHYSLSRLSGRGFKG
jgi:hypothetical protein